MVTLISLSSQELVRFCIYLHIQGFRPSNPDWDTALGAYRNHGEILEWFNLATTGSPFTAREVEMISEILRREVPQEKELRLRFFRSTRLGEKAFSLLKGWLATDRFATVSFFFLDRPVGSSYARRRDPEYPLKFYLEWMPTWAGKDLFEG